MCRVVLAMSGGVDSSVAAHLLVREGHEVIGVFLRHGEASPVTCASGGQGTAPLAIVQPRPGHRQGCCGAADAEDARQVADKLDIPFYALNFQQEFGQIMDYFVAEYAAARTPNPCIVCNNWLKFGKLFEYADSVGAEYVATGHYARITRETKPDWRGGVHVGGSSLSLCRGVDKTKDQSYVLFGVQRHRLQRMLLPVGGYGKQQIRGLAKELSLRVADKKDSQDICFVTSGKYDQWVRARRGDVDTSGQFVTSGGAVVGEHEGIERFTIGQRKGLGVALGEPRFVVRIEADSRRVVIGPRSELARRELTANRTNWLVDPPRFPRRCLAQIRYNSPATPATVESLAEEHLRVVFDEPCYGVSPGQAVVCYDAERVLGGGWIE